MSAFFVTDKTIADAVRCLNEIGIDREGLGRDLWTLNASALEHRYGRSLKEFEAIISTYADPSPSSNPFQLLKSINCLIYQCSEGDVPETALFKQLETASEALSAKVGGADLSGNRDERYDEAEWDRETDEPVVAASP